MPPQRSAAMASARGEAWSRMVGGWTSSVTPLSVPQHDSFAKRTACSRKLTGSAASSRTSASAPGILGSSQNMPPISRSLLGSRFRRKDMYLACAPSRV